MGDWCTIESDPGVFTELLANIGVNGVEIEELPGLDEYFLNQYENIYGLIFLFKYVKEPVERPCLPDGAPNVFFAKQVISNACATQAIISVLMNRPEIDLGPVLSEFKSFTMGMPSDISGLAISNSEKIRTSHNSFARPEPFISDEKRVATEDDDVFHFVGYVPVDKNVYELDGLREGPIDLGEMKDGKTFLEIAVSAIQKRMQTYTGNELRFTVQAVVPNQVDRLTNKVASLESRVKRIRAKMNGATEVTDVEGEEPLPMFPDDLKTALVTAEDNLATQRNLLQNKKEQREEWHKENVRRKHNYLPFIFALTKFVASQGKLTELADQSQKEMKERMEAKMAEMAKKKAQK